MKSWIYIWVLVSATWAFPANGQVEHNFLVGPSNTTCDSLPPTFASEKEALEMIRGSKFRFTQDFEIRRNSGFRSAYYYSCNNESGFLIVKVDDQSIIFQDVPKQIWDEFIQSNNMEGYYFRIKQKYPTLEFHPDP